MYLQPYLNFPGTCAEAFRFYETTLGGTIDMMMTHGESPIAGEVDPAWADLVLHVTLRVGDAVIMGSDAPPEMYQKPQGLYVSIGVHSVAEAERIYAAFSDGATIVMPMEKTFWAERFAMLVDRYGTPWMINCSGQEA